MSRREKVVLGLALVSGLAIAWVDSRPNWDDTGISAVAVFLCCAGLTLIEPRHLWRVALAVGIWIPALGIAATGNASSVLALAIALAGAGAGWLAARALRSHAQVEPHAGLR